MERITIVDIGPVGASIGLAIKRVGDKDTEVVGTSRDRAILSAAEKMGAVDKTSYTLGSAVSGANLVILDASLSDMRELLEAIGPILADGCVVTDTGSLKASVIEWAEQLLPPEVSFVGGHPLYKVQLREIGDADAAVFNGTRYCVIPAGSADRRSVRMVVNLVEALGAQPLFMSAQEHDSYAAAMSNLPRVLSSAFVNATAGTAGWRDMHRLAASEFDDMSRLASDDPLDTELACFANPDAVVHWLDQLITELYSYRNQIKAGGDGLVDTLVKAWEARARWEAGAVGAEDQAEVPTAGESLATMFFGSRLVKRYQERQGGDDTLKYSKRH